MLDTEVLRTRDPANFMSTLYQVQPYPAATKKSGKQNQARLALALPVSKDKDGGRKSGKKADAKGSPTGSIDDDSSRKRAYSMSRFMRMKEEFNSKMRSQSPGSRTPTILVSICDEVTSRMFLDIGTATARKNSIPNYNDTDNAKSTENRNLTNFLSLMCLRDGKFRASFPLKSLPDGDVIIRVHDGVIQFLTAAVKIDRSSMTTKCPLNKFGFIQLPMYADTRTIEFSPTEGRKETVTISGSVKGCAKYEPHIFPESEGKSSPVKPVKRRLLNIWGKFPLERSLSTCSLETKLGLHRGRSHTA